MTLWYAVIDGVRRGPMSWAELLELAASGELQPNDYVWTAEFGATWQRAHEMPELFPYRQPPEIKVVEVEEVLPPLSGDSFSPSSRVALVESWRRMRAVLFNPFDIMLWLGSGLCAWFAVVGRFDWGNLIDLRGFIMKIREGMNGEELVETIQAIPGLLQGQLAATLTLSAVALAAFFSLIMMWVRARGALLFVDRWHRPRAPFTETWRAMRREGNSLFVVRLVIMASFVLLAVMGVIWGKMAGVTALTSWLPPSLPGRLAWALYMGVLSIAWVVVIELDRELVVPILYWRRESALKAWLMVLKFCNNHPFALLSFLTMRFLVEAVVAIGVVVLTALSCCLFWVVLSIPFFGNVLFLPVTFFRCGLGISILRQWKPDLPPPNMRS